MNDADKNTHDVGSQESNLWEEYKILADYYKTYTQLSFDVAKYFVLWNITLAAGLFAGRGADLKGLIPSLITLFALIVCVVCLMGFRACIRQCALFRDRAIQIEGELPSKMFSEINAVNKRTQNTIWAARNLAGALFAIVCLIWVALFLSVVGIRVIVIGPT